MAEVAPKGTKVMIAMDGSEQAYQAFHYYLEFVHKPGFEVLVAHCPDYTNLLRTPVMSTDTSMISQTVKHCEDDVDKLVSQIKGHLQEAGVTSKLVRLHGEAGAAIVKASQEHHVNLIVTGSRGLGTVRRTLVGSVSNYVLHHAHCPVLICRAKNTKEHQKHT